LNQPIHDTFMEISEYVMFVAAGFGPTLVALELGWRLAIKKAVMGAGKVGKGEIIASVR
jgi:hypothetical protein